jgi:SNF family Na+-dependent transporter
VIGTSKRRAKEKQSLRAKKKGRRHIQSAHRKTQRLFSSLAKYKKRGHHTKVVVGPIIMSRYLSIGGYIEIFFERIMISYIPGGCCERPAGLDYRTTC